METLYYARMKRNISETEMAKAAGIPIATYRRYETRPYHFTFRQCIAMVKRLGINDFDEIEWSQGLHVVGMNDRNIFGPHIF